MELDSVRAELELLTGKYQQNELNIKKFDTSSDTVRNMCDVQLAYKENKGKGLGFSDNVAKTESLDFVVSNSVCDENILPEEPGTRADEFKTSVSVDSDNCTSASESSTNVSESSETDEVENIVLSDCVNDNEIGNKQGSSDSSIKPENQTEDSSMSDDEQSLPEDSGSSVESKPTVLETSVNSNVLNDNHSSSDKPESAIPKNSVSEEEGSNENCSQNSTPLKKKRSRKNKK
ncbi:uncharacterized protein LOC110933612 [Helianthus annuus]|uniref:uncharacterized protein LOC110933612 n=1 Tax=Helianthus annuus TaxID=4232 RepID=UPI000B8F19D8|nr:uncharacterized protein LOC110933612 [Helianthus annuus]